MPACGIPSPARGILSPACGIPSAAYGIASPAWRQVNVTRSALGTVT